MTVLGFFLNWLNFWSHVCTTHVKCHLTVVEWTEIHEALALDVLPGKTGHLERKTLGRPSWAPAAKKVNGWACSGCRCLSGRAGWHWKRCWFCDIAAFVYSRPLRHNHLDTARFRWPVSFTIELHLMPAVFNFLPTVFLALCSSSDVSLMIGFIIWLVLLTLIGCRLYQTCEVGSFTQER